MSSYLITRLPYHTKALEAIEFMQKNDYLFRVSSNFEILDALMSMSGGDSRLAIGLFEDGFQQGEEVDQLVQQLAGDSMVALVKQEVQDDHLQLQMRISQVPGILNSECDVKPEVAHQNVNSNGDLIYGRPAASEVPIYSETILGGGLTDSCQIGHILPDDSKDSVVVESSFAGNTPDDMDFDENSVLDGPKDNDMTAEDLMDDSEDDEAVEEDLAVDDTNESDGEQVTGEKENEDETKEIEDEDSVKEKKKYNRSHRASVIQKNNVVGRLLFACPVKKCRSSYKDFEDLKEHMKSHSDEDKKNISCDVCKKDFPSIGLAMQHIRKREEKICCCCGLKAKWMTTLLYHHRSHTKEKPYSCGLCKKRFSRKNGVQEHEATHTKAAKPIVCKQKRKNRMHRHSGNKPFACSLCDYRTNLKCSLKVHMRRHTGEKPYSCEQCGADFTQLSGFLCHVKKYHKE